MFQFILFQFSSEVHPMFIGIIIQLHDIKPTMPQDATYNQPCHKMPHTTSHATRCHMQPTMPQDTTCNQPCHKMPHTTSHATRCQQHIITTLYISLNTAYSDSKPSTFISSFTHSYQVFLPLPTSHPCHHHISVYPIIPTLTFHMPKPPQSTLPLHLIETLYTQKTVQIHTAFPILQRRSAHPSHHHPFRSLQTLQIRFLHRPGLSPICQCTLDTNLVYLSLYAVM